MACFSSRMAAASAALPLAYAFCKARCPSVGGTPLLVFCHGTGADEHDLLDVGEALSEALGGRLAVLSLRAPIRSDFGGFSWFEGYSAAPTERALRTTVLSSSATVLDVLDKAPALFGTHPSRTVLCGFSQGATIGWSVVTRSWPRADLLAGALLLSGRCFPQHAEEGAPLASAVAPVAELSGRRIFAAHGREDCITPAEIAKESLATATKLGLRVDYSAHSGGHDIPQALLAACAARLESWLHDSAA